jgi:hypothetical protein
MCTQAPATEAGVDMRVEALQGDGGYHLTVTVVGTTERLAREAVLNRDVTLQVDCDLDDACTYRYAGLEQRGDGAGFALKYKPGLVLSQSNNSTAPRKFSGIPGYLGSGDHQ